MQNQVKINGKKTTIEIVEKKGTICQAVVDGREYVADIEKVEPGVYSILYKNSSTNMETFEDPTGKNYSVATGGNHFDIEIIDAAARYRNSTKDNITENNNIISTPMPGKVVKIEVKEGDTVSEGQTVITISAMKMESDYKSHFNGTVKKVYVSEGDNITGNQPLIEIE